jgi:hypothetical protein
MSDVDDGDNGTTIYEVWEDDVMWMMVIMVQRFMKYER